MICPLVLSVVLNSLIIIVLSSISCLIVVNICLMYWGAPMLGAYIFIIVISSNSQSNLEKEEWNWRNQPAWLQAILQSYSHQDSMVLGQRQKYRSMEQNRKPRSKPTHLWTPYLWKRRQKYTMETRQSL